MLDDDIIMPCADLERGFARWRHHPERITGFYARILEGDPPQYQCINVSGGRGGGGPPQYQCINVRAGGRDRIVSR